jgi:hypothetical protein
MSQLSIVSARLQGYRGTVSDLISKTEDARNDCYAANDDSAGNIVTDALRALEDAHDRLQEAAAFVSGR